MKLTASILFTFQAALGLANDDAGLSYVPDGYVLSWEDSFDGPAINTSNWIIGSLRDPVTGDLVGSGSGGENAGAEGDHLLNWKNAAYITEEDTYIEDGALVLRNQKRPYHGESPWGEFNYTTGTVISMHRVHFNKGYLETRAQWPSGDKGWDGVLFCRPFDFNRYCCAVWGRNIFTLTLKISAKYHESC